MNSFVMHLASVDVVSHKQGRIIIGSSRCTPCALVLL